MTKVHFLLEPDEDGWPPVEGETLSAFRLGDYQYRLDNIPWYVRGIACYDVVEAVTFNHDEVPIVTRVIEHSGHLTIRLITSGERTAPTLLAVLAEFDKLGAAGEVDPHRGLIALDIPPTAVLSPLKQHLQRGSTEGRWDYEEGFVDDRWLAV